MRFPEARIRRFSTRASITKLRCPIVKFAFMRAIEPPEERRTYL